MFKEPGEKNIVLETTPQLEKLFRVYKFCEKKSD